MTDSRERATDQLLAALNTAAHVDVPRSVAAAIVNEILEAFDSERHYAVDKLVRARLDHQDKTLEQLSNARIAHDEQIGQLIVAVRHLSVDEFAECSSVLHGIMARRRNG